MRSLLGVVLLMCLTASAVGQVVTYEGEAFEIHSAPGGSVTNVQNDAGASGGQYRYMSATSASGYWRIWVRNLPEGIYEIWVRYPAMTSNGKYQLKATNQDGYGQGVWLDVGPQVEYRLGSGFVDLKLDYVNVPSTGDYILEWDCVGAGSTGYNLRIDKIWFVPGEVEPEPEPIPLWLGVNSDYRPSRDYGVNAIGEGGGIATRLWDTIESGIHRFLWSLNKWMANAITMFGEVAGWILRRLPAIPAGWVTQISSWAQALSPYMSLVNHYIPVTGLLVVVGVVAAWRIGCVAVHLLWKCIPFLG